MKTDDFTRILKDVISALILGLTFGQSEQLQRLLDTIAQHQAEISDERWTRIMEKTTQFVSFQELEFIRIDGRGTYFLNRDSMQLENIDDSDDVLHLVEEYRPKSYMEGPEIFHRFSKIDTKSGDEIGEDVIVDSSPNWLDALFER